MALKVKLRLIRYIEGHWIPFQPWRPSGLMTDKWLTCRRGLRRAVVFSRPTSFSQLLIFVAAFLPIMFARLRLLSYFSLGTVAFSKGLFGARSGPYFGPFVGNIGRFGPMAGWPIWLTNAWEQATNKARKMLTRVVYCGTLGQQATYSKQRHIARPRPFLWIWFLNEEKSSQGRLKRPYLPQGHLCFLLFKPKSQMHDRFLKKV